MANQNPPQFGTRTLEDFKARLIGGGARPNLFEVEINFPTFALVGDTPGTGINDDTRSVSDLTQFMCKAAQLPASNIAEIPVPFRGRVLKVAGDRTFDPWTITVINDTDFQIRTAFEKWMNGINKHDDNSGIVTPADYQRDAYVMQFGRAADGSKIPVHKAYRFYGVFPTNVSEIEVSYDNSDVIEEFTVTLQVQWWDALDGNGRTQLNTDPEVTDPG